MRAFTLLIAIVSAVGLAPTFAGAAPEGWAPLLEPRELAEMRADAPGIRIVHVSGGYVRGHIPDAVNAPFEAWRGPPANPGALPALAELEALVRSLGIAATTPVVLVHAGSSPADMGTAARVYWTLRSLGVADLAILNGGFRGWIDAGLPVESGRVTVAPSDFSPEWHDDWRVTTAEMEDLVAADAARLIDARRPPFFSGDDWNIARPGTIAGADNLPYQAWFDGYRMIDRAPLRRVAAGYGLDGSTIAATFCNTGHLAAINWFALSEIAGFENTRLYAESMAEWTQEFRPLDNGPGRLAVYWTQTQDWIDGLF